jgi:hypothetical protein
MLRMGIKMKKAFILVFSLVFSGFLFVLPCGAQTAQWPGTSSPPGYAMYPEARSYYSGAPDPGIYEARSGQTAQQSPSPYLQQQYQPSVQQYTPPPVAQYQAPVQQPPVVQYHQYQVPVQAPPPVVQYQAPPVVQYQTPPAAQYQPPVPAPAPVFQQYTQPYPGSSGRPCRIQVGAYHNVMNAQAAFSRIVSTGLSPAYEQYGNLYRVVISGVKEYDVPEAARRLEAAGFLDLWVRLEN